MSQENNSPKPIDPQELLKVIGENTFKPKEGEDERNLAEEFEKATKQPLIRFRDKPETEDLASFLRQENPEQIETAETTRVAFAKAANAIEKTPPEEILKAINAFTPERLDDLNTKLKKQNSRIRRELKTENTHSIKEPNKKKGGEKSKTTKPDLSVDTLSINRTDHQFEKETNLETNKRPQVETIDFIPRASREQRPVEKIDFVPRASREVIKNQEENTPETKAQNITIESIKLSRARKEISVIFEEAIKIADNNLGKARALYIAQLRPTLKHQQTKGMLHNIMSGFSQFFIAKPKVDDNLEISKKKYEQAIEEFARCTSNKNLLAQVDRIIDSIGVGNKKEEILEAETEKCIERIQHQILIEEKILILQAQEQNLTEGDRILFERIFETKGNQSFLNGVDSDIISEALSS